MRIKIIIVILIVAVKSSESQISEFACTRDVGDNKTCYFSDIDDGYKFFEYLVNMTDPSKTEITKIYFKNCELENIPKELTYEFFNVETLDASDVRLTRVKSFDFNPENKIQYLNVSLNFLSSLVKRELPEMMNRLISLDMSHNLIDKVDDDVFNYNSNLKLLNLSHNRIIKLGMEFFESAKNLEILRLNNNRISHITWYSSGVETTLKELYLQNNELTTFYPSMIPSATFLDLSHNNLEEDLDFSGDNLIDLKVSNNLLQSLKINKNLQTLDASSNEDKSFRIDFNDSKALKILSLSKSRITYDFNNMKFPQTLEFLDISRCEIYSLSSLENILSNLKTIDIRGSFLNCDDMKEIAKNFQSGKFLSDFNETQMNDYIIKNCANDHQEGESSQNKLLWAILITLMLGYVFGALFYANRRFNLVDRLIKRTSGFKGFVRNESNDLVL